MATHLENELMCRVGPGGQMGNWFREFWMPEGFAAQNQWHQVRAAMAARDSFSGLGIDHMPYGPFLEDVAVCESMGPIVDRTKESLCTAGIAIAQARRVYLSAVRAHMCGEKPLGLGVDTSRMSLKDGPEQEDHTRRSQHDELPA